MKGMERVYFDANATTPPLPEVVEAVAMGLREARGNPTSTHREGQRARARLEDARCRIAEGLGVQPGELVFCSSATEALHLLLEGLRPALGHRPAAVFPGEHSSCLHPVRAWARVHDLPEIPEGCATVIQMAANNETGICYPMPRVAGAVHLQDAVQAWGKVPLDWSGCDAAVLSGHKVGGPRGAAVLWMRPGLPWVPVMEGPQERRRRGGTEDLPAILGLAEAARKVPERLERYRSVARLRDAMEAEVLTWNLDVEIVGRTQQRLPNTSCMMARGRRGDVVQMALDLAGYAVSTGSACHSGATEPSHALTCLGYDESEARSAVRVSLLPDATSDQVEGFLKVLRSILQRG